MKFSCNYRKDEAALSCGKRATNVRALVFNRTNNRANANGNRNMDNNNARLVEIERAAGHDIMFLKICSYENLFNAYIKARKGKTQKHYVLEFEKNLKENLLHLRTELLFHSYRPQPLNIFIVHDPKTRKISKSEFRDRIVHHALCNILEPIYEQIFIHDSFANRIGKGSLAVMKRFHAFKRKVAQYTTSNRPISGYCLKADIRQYFETVDHEVLIRILKQKVSKETLFLIKCIINNYSGKHAGKGMPLGNLTSQFFANVYLNELDQFVKHNLKVKYYIRYVDDFVILHANRKHLEIVRQQISEFLHSLCISLHPKKSHIIPLSHGIDFLGFRIFHHHKLLRKSNLRRFKRKSMLLKILFDKNKISYDDVYNQMLGSCAYARHANTHNLITKISRIHDQLFPNQIPAYEIDRWLKKQQKRKIRA